MSFINSKLCPRTLAVLILIVSFQIDKSWTFSYSYRINHGGPSSKARSYVSFPQGHNSVSYYHPSPSSISNSYSPPNSPPANLPQSPSYLHSSYSPNLLSNSNSHPQNVYHSTSDPEIARYTRICQRSDGVKGFRVGQHTTTGELCYYICADRQFLRRPFYYCCPSGYRMDYDLRLCKQGSSETKVVQQIEQQTKSIQQPVPSLIKRRLTIDEVNRLNDDQPNYLYGSRIQSQKTQTFYEPVTAESTASKPTVENPYGKCEPGVLYKPHPDRNKCDHYLQCVFNLVYIDQKCPLGLWWNDRIKFCDIKQNATCRKRLEERVDEESEANFLGTWNRKQTNTWGRRIKKKKPDGQDQANYNYGGVKGVKRPTVNEQTYPPQSEVDQYYKYGGVKSRKPIQQPDEDDSWGVKTIRPVTKTQTVLKRKGSLTPPADNIYPQQTQNNNRPSEPFGTIRCTNRWQEAFYRRKYGINCRKQQWNQSSNEAVDNVVDQSTKSGEAPPSKTFQFGQRKRRPFWQLGTKNPEPPTKTVIRKGIKIPPQRPEEPPTKSRPPTKTRPRPPTKTGPPTKTRLPTKTRPRPPIKIRPRPPTKTRTTTTTPAPETPTPTTEEPTSPIFQVTENPKEITEIVEVIPPVRKSTTKAPISQVTESTDFITEKVTIVTVPTRTTTTTTTTTTPIPTTLPKETPPPPTTTVTTPAPTTVIKTTTEGTTISQEPETSEPSSSASPTTTEPSTIAATTTLKPTTIVEPTTQPPTSAPTTQPPTTTAIPTTTTTATETPTVSVEPTTAPPTTTTTTTTEIPVLPTNAPLVNVTTTTAETTTFKLILEESAKCQDAGQRFKDIDNCQCYFECQLNGKLTKNCCPEGLYFNQNEAKPGDTNSDESDESEGENPVCDVPDNVPSCKTIIQ